MRPQDQGVVPSDDRYSVVPRTLSFVTNGDDVLLLKGAPQKRLWANCYNGVGGHVERDEDVYAAALREICEETGWQQTDVNDLSLRVLISVDVRDGTKGIMLFVFTATSRRRKTLPSTEGILEWIPRSRILEYALVEDLPVLLPRALSRPAAAAPLFAHYHYDENDRLQIRFRDPATRRS